MIAKDLHILDVSGFIHTGNVNKYARIEGEFKQDEDGEWGADTISTGGVAYLVKRVAELKPFAADIVGACDRMPSVKRSVDSEYKITRKHSSTILTQKEIAEMMLEDCGCGVIAAEGYEADDTIYTLVQQNKDKYRLIFIHTDDSDNYINVAPNVWCIPVRTKGKVCNMETYPYACRNKLVTPYNEIAYLNVATGKAKDNVPALPDHLYNDWVKLREVCADLGDSREVIDAAYRISSDLGFYVYLGYPLYIDDLRVNTRTDIDYTRVLAWGTMVGYTKGHKTPIPEDLKQVRRELLRRPEYLNVSI